MRMSLWDILLLRLTLAGNYFNAQEYVLDLQITISNGVMPFLLQMTPAALNSQRQVTPSRRLTKQAAQYGQGAHLLLTR